MLHVTRDPILRCSTYLAWAEQVVHVNRVCAMDIVLNRLMTVPCHTVSNVVSPTCNCQIKINGGSVASESYRQMDYTLP